MMHEGDLQWQLDVALEGRPQLALQAQVTLQLALPFP